MAHVDTVEASTVNQKSKIAPSPARRNQPDGEISIKFDTISENVNVGGDIVSMKLTALIIDGNSFAKYASDMLIRKYLL